MQGWSSQRLLSSGEAGDPITKVVNLFVHILSPSSVYLHLCVLMAIPISFVHRIKMPSLCKNVRNSLKVLVSSLIQFLKFLVVSVDAFGTVSITSLFWE